MKNSIVEFLFTSDKNKAYCTKKNCIHKNPIFINSKKKNVFKKKKPH